MELLDTDYSAGFLSSDSPLNSDQLICVGIVGILPAFDRIGIYKCWL